MKKIKSIFTVGLSAVVIPLLTTGCSDSWGDHFDTIKEGTGTETIFKLVSDNPQLSDFVKVCQATHLYNNMHTTPVTYAELLASDQSLTVWAPVNGSFDVDSLLDLCKTAQGDSAVGVRFVSNHISRSLYNMNSSTDENVKMLNDKFLNLTSRKLYKSEVIGNNYNLPASNGLLHVINETAPYCYNVYEGLTSLEKYSHIGTFIKQFEQLKLDEEHSIQSGLDNGKKVYSDSVMVTENTLFRKFDNIVSEDSTFLMLVPTKEVWDTVYNEASKFFNFGSIEKADSIERYWKNVCLVQDLIFNTNKAVNHSLQDSIISTSFSPAEYPYHVYYKPYSADGLFNQIEIIDTMKCSNGYFYNISNWPFTAKDLYFHPVITEGEREANMIEYNQCTTNIRDTKNPKISGGGYLDIVPKSSVSNWTATFEIKNTLSGTYDICVVTLPKTAYLATSKDTKPNKFKATLKYHDLEGKEKTISYKNELTNSGTKIDTVVIGRHTFPTCNYMQQDATVTLQLQCYITSRQTNYSREMYLDCIYFRPVTDEEIAAEAQTAKKRKEVRK